jgi:hypothetical protein
VNSIASPKFSESDFETKILMLEESRPDYYETGNFKFGRLGKRISSRELLESPPPPKRRSQVRVESQKQLAINSRM